MGKTILHTALLVLCLAALAGCKSEGTKARQWQITLRKEDKNPYGAYLAYESLKYYFSGAKIEALSPQFRYTSITDEMNYPDGSPNLLVLLGLDLNLSELEWASLKHFARGGNEVVIFCSRLDQKVEDGLNQRKMLSFEEQPFDGSNNTNLNTLSISGSENKLYGYKGRSLQGYFTTIDTALYVADSTDSASGEAQYIYGPDTLGFTGSNPDILRFTLGNGHITLHAAPLAMSNYFLLQDSNINYLTALWRTLPAGIGHVYWNNYLVRSAEESSFDILLRFQATRWALMLCILVLACYVLFQMKRRQRIIPIVQPLKNDSVAFVETVGRLYYNKGNHNNLAEKMVQQYLEWVRNHYYLNTNLLNEEFTRQLIMKSGEPEAMVTGLVNMIHEVKIGHMKIDDAYLYQLHQTIQHFYKNHQK